MTSAPRRPAGAIGRRTFLRRSAAAGAGAVTAPAALAACDPGDHRGRRDYDPTAPLEVVVPAGGYGDGPVRYAALAYEKRFPGAEVTVRGVPRVGTVLRSRFAAGDPPDVVDDSGARAVDPAELIAQGRLADLAPLLGAPSLDDAGRTVGRTLVEGSLAGGTFGDTVNALPYVLTAWTTWHDAQVFEDRGWEYPRTWSGLLDLSAEIRRSGTTPFVYPGAAYLRISLHATAFRVSGRDVWKAVDNLEPGAWQQDEIVAALAAFHRLAERGYVRPAATPAAARTRMIRGDAALLPSGSWLASRTRGRVPEGVRLTATPFPSVTGDDRVPFAAVTYGAGERFVVPVDARNRAGGLEFLRVLCSRRVARRFAELTRATTVVDGAHDDQRLGPAFDSVVACLRNASAVPRVPSPRYATWYRTLAAEAERAIAAMMTATVDPERTAARIQRRADDVMRDGRIEKRRR